MVNRNEIKPGISLTYPNSKPFKVSVDQLMDSRFWEDIDQNIEPIPLTTCVLSEYGFYWDREINRWVHCSTCFRVVQYSAKEFKVEIGYGQFDYPTFKYLHQLETIYLSITGCELLKE